MEEAKVRFGDITSADFKLWLTGPNNEDYERNPVHLHSVILQRSEYFRAMMSDRWSSGTPSERRLNISHNFDDYLKCIEIMYGEQVYFSNVEECVAILSVACELLYRDCINKCMQYLEAVRWSAEQESQIRNVLVHLQWRLLPDLEARLDKKDDDNITFVEGVIMEMVALITDQKSSVRNRRTAEEYIRGILEGNVCRDVVEVCERALLQELKSSIDSHSFEAIASLFKFIELCDRKVLEVCGRMLLQEFKSSIDSHSFHRIALLLKCIEVCDGEVEVCRRMLLQEFKSSIHPRKVYEMKSLFKHIKHCDGDILKAAFIAFCEDPQFSKEAKYMCDQHKKNFHKPHEYCKYVFNIIKWFIKAIGDGNIIISRASRISFLTTWLPIMGNIIRCVIFHTSKLDKLGEFDRATLKAIECLPPVDRKSICVIWLEVYREYGIDITAPFSLFKDLHNAHYKSTSK